MWCVRVCIVRCACVNVSMRLYAEPPCKGYRPALWYAATAVCRISSKHHTVNLCVCVENVFLIYIYDIVYVQRGDFTVNTHKLLSATGYGAKDLRGSN